MYQLKDLQGNVTLTASDQIFACIDEMRKLNKRMCRFIDCAENETDKELAIMYERWSNDIHSEVNGMVKAFNMLTGYDISIVNLLFDKIEKI